MFGKYIGENSKLDQFDKEMMELADKYGIDNVESLMFYGVEGIIKNQYQGFYDGAYYYGEEHDCVGVIFSIYLDKEDVGNSDIMLSSGFIVKDNKLIHEQGI